MELSGLRSLGIFGSFDW